MSIEDKKRILSGMRPTGKLHLGNYTGALENWVRMQRECQNFHLVADYHVLTTDVDHVDTILPNTLEMVKDWLAAGIDPQVSPLFRQSQIKEHAELHLIFSMLVTKNRLERNPAVKEQVRDLGLEDLMTYGHLGYPVLQAADILLYKGDAVPVGEDQLPHIEITREIARRFNRLYVEIFPEPEGIVTRFARLPGPDGRRMSKSLGNAIFLADSEKETAAKLMQAITDPQKVRRHDPGHPEVCNIYHYHTKFNSLEVPQITHDCRSGVLGCVACKKNCAVILNGVLTPIREKRAQYDNHEDTVLEILIDGEKRARIVAQQTMMEVHEAMKIG